MKECYYEILGVERDATDEEIKKAYRRQAVKWHPDKNTDDLERATARFQQLNHAFQVLSDATERRWYDEHRGDILRDDDDVEPDELNLWPLFSPSSFSGFDESPTGFYGVYGAAFQSVASEEEARGSGGSFPEFGVGSSPMEDVLRFYRAWGEFSSGKNFSWRDAYDLSGQELSRFAKRAMEKENKKERARARREFSEQVRNLVLFCRHRDPRMQQYERDREAAEAKEREAARVREEEARVAAEAEREERKRLREIALEEHDRWVRENHVFRLDDEQQSPEPASSPAGEKSATSCSEYLCGLCTKSFKTRKTYECHAKSKKHLEALKEKPDFVPEFYHCLRCDAFFPELPEECDICGLTMDEAYRLGMSSESSPATPAAPEEASEAAPELPKAKGSSKKAPKQAKTKSSSTKGVGRSKAKEIARSVPPSPAESSEKASERPKAFSPSS